MWNEQSNGLLFDTDMHTHTYTHTQISDVEQIMGLMNTETVQIQAEAYDVALDISFPRGE